MEQKVKDKPITHFEEFLNIKGIIESIFTIEKGLQRLRRERNYFMAGCAKIKLFWELELTPKQKLQLKELDSRYFNMNKASETGKESLYSLSERQAQLYNFKTKSLNATKDKSLLLTKSEIAKLETWFKNLKDAELSSQRSMREISENDKPVSETENLVDSNYNETSNGEVNLNSQTLSELKAEFSKLFLNNHKKYKKSDSDSQILEQNKPHLSKNPVVTHKSDTDEKQAGFDDGFLSKILELISNVQEEIKDIKKSEDESKLLMQKAIVEHNKMHQLEDKVNTLTKKIENYEKDKEFNSSVIKCLVLHFQEIKMLKYEAEEIRECLKLEQKKINEEFHQINLQLQKLQKHIHNNGKSNKKLSMIF